MSESKPTISYDDFQKLDIRIGTITSAEKVPETDKLVKFEIDLGSEKREVVGGFAQAYPDPSELVGKQVPILINLEPRMLRGLESQGMILAATADDLPVPLHPAKETPPGAIIK